MRRSITLAWVLFVFSVVTVTGFGANCQEKSANSSRAKPSARSQSVSKSPQKSQLSDGDCRAFASQVVEAIRTR